MFRIILVCLLFKQTLTACPVHINILDKDRNPLSKVRVIAGGERQGDTNTSGYVRLSLKEGSHTLVFQISNAEIIRFRIEVSCLSENRFEFIVNPDTVGVIDLDEVVIQAAPDKKVIDQSPFSVRTINIRQEHHKGGDIGEVLNRASGVRLRSDGNIGAPVQISLGGLQGKAVRMFKDGIPVELFGHGFSLGTIPTNMLERVEIYKGIMPLYLASDALGGGVNLVSRKIDEPIAEVSYEAGSFNTHRATAHFLRQNKTKKWYGGASSSFNYSDNSYKVHVPVYDMETGVSQYHDLRRFHDATRSLYLEAYAGIQNRDWAEDLRITLIGSDFYKEIQHDAEMNKVYGEPFSREKNVAALINYKNDFFDQRLKVTFLNSYSYFYTRFIDTATVRYGWDGNVIAGNLHRGEISLGNNQQLNYHFTSSRLGISYKLSDNHSLDFNELYYRQNRKGSDPLGAISAIERIDVLTVPAIYSKNITGLGLRSTWLRKRLESIVAVKHYHFNTAGYTTDNFGLGWRSRSRGQQLGYLAGIRWSSRRYQLKASYENANRLPDEYEIFGDARLVKENMDLKPEKSHNINLNARYSVVDGAQSFAVSTGLFYRHVRDIIFLQLDIPFNRYINYEEAEIKGVEIESDYTPNRFFDLGLNITYQDIRRVNIREPVFRNLEGSRIPNVPFLFGNAWINTHFSNLFNKEDRLEVNWNAGYTHRFLLHAVSKSQEPTLFGGVKSFQTSLIIPRDGRIGQLANNLGIYYHFSNHKVSVSAECRNIGNVRLYDNFNVQKPGRSYHIKFVYHLI